MTIRGIGGTWLRRQVSELDPAWAANRVTRNGTQGSMWVDHM